MDDLLNGRRRHASAFTDPVHPINDRVFRSGVGCQNLDGSHAIGRFKDNVRECTTNIDTQPNFHIRPLL